MMQSKTTIQNKSTENSTGTSGATATRTLQAVSVLQKAVPDEELLQKKPNSTGLPDNLKSGVENLSGFSMDDVKVHYNSDKPTQLQAHAYAQGTNIHVAPGQEKHLPHEAWHVVQQKQRRVQPTMQMKEGVAVNDDKGLESEADVMGGKAMQIPVASKPLQLMETSYPPNNLSIQLQEIETFGGKFKTDGYKFRPFTTKNVKSKGVGCTMNLEFYANDTVNCAQIGLTQTTTPTFKNESVKFVNYAAPRGLNRATNDTVEGDFVEKARYLDRTDYNNHPVFGAQNPVEEPDLVPESFHNEQKDQLGAHVIDEIGKVTEDKPAKLLDEPGREWENGWTVIQTFETTAICLIGPMKGDYLGCVEWGYIYGAEDVGNILPLKKISDGMPSLKFMEAVVNWNKSKIPQPLSEVEKSTVPLPENERVGNGEALSLPHRKFMLDQIDTLSQESVLNLLEDPVFSTHSKQLLLKRLYNLMSNDFVYSWSNAFKHRVLLNDILLKLRDEYAKKMQWMPETWAIDIDVRKLIKKLSGLENVPNSGTVTVAQLRTLFDNVDIAIPVLLCLNPDFSEESIIEERKHFQVPGLYLNTEAKAL